MNGVNWLASLEDAQMHGRYGFRDLGTMVVSGCGGLQKAVAMPRTDVSSANADAGVTVRRFERPRGEIWDDAGVTVALRTASD